MTEKSAYLESFTKQFIATALWCNVDKNDKPLRDNYSERNFANSTMATITTICRKFVLDNWELLRQFDAEQTGDDFYLTCNRTGGGYWDGDYPEEIGNKLTEASHKYGETSLYVSRGKVYIFVG